MSILPQRGLGSFYIELDDNSPKAGLFDLAKGAMRHRLGQKLRTGSHQGQLIMRRRAGGLVRRMSQLL
jgi:hypothetical protein